MDKVKQSVKILATNLTNEELPFSYDDPGKLIEYAGRLCYKTEDRQTTDSWMSFLDKRRKQGHKSIFEHAWEVKWSQNEKTFSPFLFHSSFGFVAGNLLAFEEEENKSVRHLPKLTTEQIIDYALASHFPKACAITAHFTTNRGITHEFVRHRFPVSFSQESTRYVNYKGGITVIEQDWFDKAPFYLSYSYNSFLAKVEDFYQYLINNGVPPQIARDVLPQATKAEIIVTTHLPEWKHIIRQRTAKEAHPQFRELMEMFVTEVKKFYPNITEE